MKLAFLLLILVNILLFAWQQGVFGRYVESGREPERVARQIEPERIRVLTEGEVQTLRERARQSTGPLDLTVAQACLEFGDFGPGEAARAEHALAALATSSRPTARAIDAPGWFIVYLPPYKTSAEAERRAAELRKLGITDMLVLTENSPMKFGISLGSFRDPNAAKAHLVVARRLFDSVEPGYAQMGSHWLPLVVVLVSSPPSPSKRGRLRATRAAWAGEAAPTHRG